MNGQVVEFDQQFDMEPWSQLRELCLTDRGLPGLSFQVLPLLEPNA